MEDSEKKSWGGAREGSGRKRVAVKSYSFGATAEVSAILEAYEGNKTAFINRCILMAAEACR